MRDRNRGVTLVELMIGMVVVGIMLMAAGPSFVNMIDRNRVATQVNDFLLAVNIARSEASRTGATVTLQAVGTNTGNEFGEGFCVVAGPGGDCNGDLIRSFEPLSGGTTLDSLDQSNIRTIQFSPLGSLANTNDQALRFDLCANNTEGRRIIISLIGRSKSHAPDDPDTNRRPSC